MTCVARPPLLLPIRPTRVRRSYRGGRLLDELEGRASPADSDRPENWIASTTPALNPGLPPETGEGLTLTSDPAGNITTLAAWLRAAPEFYLGADHMRRHGPHPGFLAKLLDSATRLSLQVHPTAAFARAHLGAPHGKLEAYYVLAVRAGADATLRLGFQRPPGRDRWREIVATQDLAAMEACFDPIPLQPGDIWVVPGGFPHAIGAGVLMVEIMEPSDLVVRCEFARDGIAVPPAARFMGRDLDFCLDVFDYTARPVETIRRLCRSEPALLASGPAWNLERLVGPERTTCFEIRRLRACAPCTLATDGRPWLIVQTHGEGTARAGDTPVPTRRGSSVFAAAAAESLAFVPAAADAEWLLCAPAPPSPSPP